MGAAAPFRQPLRRDPRGWQIEDDEAAEAVLVALESMGLIFAELILHAISNGGMLNNVNEELAVRGIGSTAGRVGMSRLSWLTGLDELGQKRREQSDNPMAEGAGERVRTVLHWLLEWELHNPDAPPRLRPPSAPPPKVALALDDLHAVVTYFSRRSANSGMAGPGLRRRIARSTTRSGS